MRAIAARMHAHRAGAARAHAQRPRDEARLRYFGEIEEDLDDHLQRLIDLAIADEEEEVRQVDHQTAALARELSSIVVVAVTLLAAVPASWPW